MVTYLSKDNRCLLKSGECQGFFYSIICVDAPYRMGYIAIPEGHPWYDITCEEYLSHPEVFPFDIQCVQPYTHYDDPSDASTTITNYKWWGFAANSIDDLHDLSLLEHAVETVKEQSGKQEAESERDFFLLVITREAEQMASWDKSRSLHPKPTVKTTEDMVAILEEACNLARKATDQLLLEI